MKGYSAQHALISMLEKWRISLDNQGFAGAVLMDLSKAFDKLNHELIIAKIHAYGFDKDVLRLIKSCLSNRWQRTKINASYSSWSELISGVPQSSVVGPVLFNIYINDLFFLIENTKVCNYADDTTIHSCEMSLNILIKRLEDDATIVIDWFRYNYMKFNPNKCHILISGYKHDIGKSRKCQPRQMPYLD